MPGLKISAQRRESTDKKEAGRRTGEKETTMRKEEKRTGDLKTTSIRRGRDRGRGRSRGKNRRRSCHTQLESSSESSDSSSSSSIVSSDYERSVCGESGGNWIECKSHEKWCHLHCVSIEVDVDIKILFCQ